MRGKGGGDVSWFVDVELDPLHRHIVSVYPLAESDATEHEVLDHVCRADGNFVDPTRRSWLRRLAREAIFRPVANPAEWQSLNRQMLDLDFRATAKALSNPETRSRVIALGDAMRALPVESAEVLRMTSVESLTLEELSTILRVSTSDAQARLQRAQRSLLAALGPFGTHNAEVGDDG